MCLPIIVRFLSLQRVLVQATGSAQKGAQVQQLSVPRVQQVPQQVHSSSPLIPSPQPPGHSVSLASDHGSIHSSIRHIESDYILHCIVSVLALEWYGFLTDRIDVRSQLYVLQLLSRDFYLFSVWHFGLTATYWQHCVKIWPRLWLWKTWFTLKFLLIHNKHRYPI